MQGKSNIFSIFLAFQTLSSRQLNNRGFSLIILKKAKNPRLQQARILSHTAISLHGNPSKRVRHGTDQNNDCKYRAQVLDHDLEYSLSVELAFPVKHLFLNPFHAYDSGYQKTGRNGRDRHHDGVCQEIEEIQKLHSNDGNIG